MPLIPIVDPVLTGREKEEWLAKVDEKHPGLPADAKPMMARVLWRSHMREQDPDFFIVGFAAHFPDYETYINSAEWFEIRHKILTAANQRCAGCGRKATQVHHRDYRPRVLRGEDLSALVPLCRTCHKWIHTDANGKHENIWNDAEDRLNKLVNDHEAKVAAAATAPPPLLKERRRRDRINFFED